jgi:hypothetical protein
LAPIGATTLAQEDCSNPVNDEGFEKAIAAYAVIDCLVEPMFGAA